MSVSILLCNEFDELMLSYLIGGQLTKLDKVRVCNHLRKCTCCQKISKNIRSLESILIKFNVLSLKLGKQINCFQYKGLLSRDLETSTDNKSILAGHIRACSACRQKIPIILCNNFYRVLDNVIISSYDYLKLYKHASSCIECFSFLDVNGLRLLMRKMKKAN